MTSAERLITKAVEARLAIHERTRRAITDVVNEDTVRTETLSPKLKHALTALARLNRAKRPYQDLLKAAHLQFDEEQVPVAVRYDYGFRHAQSEAAKKAAWATYNAQRDAIGKLDRAAKAAVLGKSNKDAQPIVERLLADLEKV